MCLWKLKKMVAGCFFTRLLKGIYQTSLEPPVIPAHVLSKSSFITLENNPPSRPGKVNKAIRKKIPRKFCIKTSLCPALTCEQLGAVCVVSICGCVGLFLGRNQRRVWRGIGDRLQAGLSGGQSGCFSGSGCNFYCHLHHYWLSRK